MVLINEIIGQFGPYHYWLCLIIFISRFGVAFHQMAIIFLAPPANFTCPDEKMTCCPNPIYDRSVFNSTIVTEWNLICERSWLKEFNQTIFQFGVLVGSLLYGIASDRYGRKPTLISSVLLEIFSGVMSSFLPDYWSFTVARFILGISVGGVMVITFVIIMEYVGSTKRDIISALFHVPFTIGYILLAVFGYFIRDYTYFQLGISLSNVILLLYICVLPESPRWLLAMNRTEEAITLLEQVAKANMLPTEDIRNKIEMFQIDHKIVKSKSVVLDLYRKPNLRRNILVMSFTWLVCSYYFYGMAQYISHLTGDIFINVVASGSVCLCGCIIAIPLIKFTNRKTVVIVSNGLCSFCIFIVVFVREGETSVVLGCIGVMCCYVGFIILYLYCSEMFPTVVRNAALGFCSMMARVGAMLAPFVVDMKQYGEWCAPLAFGVFPIAAALLCLLLPETKDCELLMTIEEGDKYFGRQQQRNKSLPTEKR